MGDGPPRRRIPAAVTAVLLLLLAILVGWAAAEQLVARRWPTFAERLFAGLQNTAWTSTLGWALGVGLTILGILVMAVAVSGRTHTLGVVSPPSPHVRHGQVVLTRNGLSRLVAGRICDIDGVDRAAVRVVGRRVRARIRTSLSDTTALRSAVRDALAAQFTEIGLTPPPKISIKTAHQEVRS